MSQFVKCNSPGKSRTVSIRTFLLRENQENLQEEKIVRKKQEYQEMLDKKLKLLDNQGPCTVSVHGVCWMSTGRTNGLM